MRLTLRTLLAYLDDTLEPLEIKTIGQKVSESETAQELIARIKQATRRRRITTPPATGPNSFESNMVADYLDNELSQEQVAELEKICLESDVHLAEVASCHQILTLVLGEPSAVPPTSKERMYALVHGREAIPFRKAAAAGSSASPSGADRDADEMFLLGLPFYRRGSWLRWALPLAAVLLFAIVGVALWQTLLGVQQPQNRGDKQQVTQNNNAAPNPIVNQPNPPNPSPRERTDKGNDAKSLPRTPNTNDAKGPNKPIDPGPDKTKPDNPPSAPESEGRPPANADAPSTEREALGKYHTDPSQRPTLLVYWKEEANAPKDDKDKWKRVEPGGKVYSRDRLVSLPGYASEIRLDCGVHLLLRGHLREFTPSLVVPGEEGKPVVKKMYIMDNLQESYIVLHKSKDKSLDVDLTLVRGRLYLSNHETTKRVVRLRFEKKVWDLTLGPDAEWVVDHIKQSHAGQSLVRVNCLLLRGEGGIALDRQEFPSLSALEGSYFQWKNDRPDHVDRVRANRDDVEKQARVVFSKEPAVDPMSKEVRGMELALKKLIGLMSLDTSPRTAFEETKNPAAEDPYLRRLAFYCQASLDYVKDLLGFLNESDARHAPDRLFAIIALRRWLDHEPEQLQKLYDPRNDKKSLLRRLQFTENQAKRIVELLTDPTDDDIWRNKDTYTALAGDLLSNQPLIAELARWRLVLLSEAVRVPLTKLVHFNAAMPKADREAAAAEVYDKVNQSLLPPDLNRAAKPSGDAPALKGTTNPPNPRPKK